jgi:hypothetical protein
MPAARADTSPIFVGGLMKSGTSLLRKLLANHPAVFGGLETHWFTDDVRLRWRDSGGRRQQWLREFYDLSSDDYDRLARDARDGIEFLDSLMRHCTLRAGKERWIEKTPDNILHLDLIWERWPAAHVLHVVRDYRDVYASWKRNGKLSLGEFLRQVHLVGGAVEAIQGDRRDQYFEVDYNELVDATEFVLREVCAFVGERYVAGLSAYDGDDSDFQKVLAVTGTESATTRSLSQPIFRSSIGQWRSTLSEGELTTIESEFASDMRARGWL